MDKFFIISNYGKASCIQLAQEIRNYLVNRGCLCGLDTGVYNEAYEGGDQYRYTNPDEVPDDTQCILVIGGDGTMLQAARDMKHKGIPILGINQGTLGYMTEINPDSMEYALECLIKDRYTLEKRMFLRGSLIRNGECRVYDYALNDIVVSRSEAEINSYNVYVDGAFLKHYAADGIILATPTGSTAYNLSAGGPLVDPKAFSILLTPICPHGLHSRSIVLSADSKIILEAEMRPGKKFISPQICFDGNCMGVLRPGDQLIIEQAEVKACILKVSNVSFLETLRRKMSEQ